MEQLLTELQRVCVCVCVCVCVRETEDDVHAPVDEEIRVVRLVALLSLVLERRFEREWLATGVGSLI